jgi:hypothetical protein
MSTSWRADSNRSGLLRRRGGSTPLRARAKRVRPDRPPADRRRCARCRRHCVARHTTAQRRRAWWTALPADSCKHGESIGQGCHLVKPNRVPQPRRTCFRWSNALFWVRQVLGRGVDFRRVGDNRGAMRHSRIHAAVRSPSPSPRPTPAKMIWTPPGGTRASSSPPRDHPASVPPRTASNRRPFAMTSLSHAVARRLGRAKLAFDRHGLHVGECRVPTCSGVRFRLSCPNMRTRSTSAAGDREHGRLFVDRGCAGCDRCRFVAARARSIVTARPYLDVQAAET